MTYAGKEDLLRVVRYEADRMFELAERPGAWEAPTACAGWDIRDVVNHLVDVTEASFDAFDAAKGRREATETYCVRSMATRTNERALSFGDVSQRERWIDCSPTSRG